MSRQVLLFCAWISLLHRFFFPFSGGLSDFPLLQMDVFNTFIELLRQTGNVTKGQDDINELRQVFLFTYP